MKTSRARRWLWWLAALSFFCLAFDLAMSQDVEEAGVDALHALPRPEIRRVIPLGAIQIAIRIRRRLPVVGAPSAWVARKLVSVVLFGMAGWFGIMLTRAAGERVGSKHFAASLIAATLLSALIEWAQAPEPADDVALDIACGIAGGLLAAAVARGLDSARLKRAQGARGA
ncbi:MAG: hypothetical protein GIW99_09960 [Candidatus Eremiobacteraeota bacterium]|nr:hypothetical protein [Candidatus Eremiobacteraeota bacterium]MBC5827987.1 hypothetical protein [Candidatus Eremiobacteraeota bacterium]